MKSISFFHRFTLVALTVAMLGFSGCRMNFSMVDGYFFDFSGETAEFQDQGAIDEGVTIVKIDNRFGDVKIVHATDQPGWTWESKVWADTQELADQFIQEFVMDVQTEGDTQTWTVLLPESSAELNGVQSNLTLNVPSHVEVQLENRHGDVELKDLTGTLVVENAHGNLDARQIAGGTLTVSHGDTTVESSTGNLSIDSSHGDVKVDGVEGELTIDGRHSEIKAQDVSANADFKTTHDNIVVSELRGDVNLNNRHGNITATGLEGSVTSENRHGTTTIAASGNTVSAESAHGDVRVTVTSESFTSIELETSHGSIELELPASASPTITMDTSYGDTDSEFESTNASSQSVVLKNQHGDINVKKSSK